MGFAEDMEDALTIALVSTRRVGSLSLGDR